MSLDVYLRNGVPQASRTGIYIRENGQTRELTRDEWDERFPGREPVVAEVESDDAAYNDNITHNLGKMAAAAGLYEPLWRPEEIGIRIAADLVTLLENGLARLEANPDYYKTFNPPNGWGDYDGLVTFARRYLRACKQHPTAEVYASP